MNNHVNLLNISELMKENIGTLSYLDVDYGELSCILYTSGTTGIPKGVKITRKSIVNLATVYRDKYELTNNDIYGLFSTIGFDAALLAIVAVLYSGACLSVIPNDIRLDIEKMNEYFISHNVTHTLITTQVGKLFIENVNHTSLKVLLVGGEKLGEFESPEDYTLVDAFGPTEACVFISSIKNIDKIDSSSIGPLSYNTKAYVLDDELRRVPLGATGELYISGYQLSDGYLNREKETKEAFIENPFENNENYKVMYSSGDMVRILNDGSLAIVGRSDSQVKIRGNRVELSEIEEVIRELDSIKDVTIQTIENNGNNELVAYVVPLNEIEYLKDYVCNHVIKNKPEYMVPSYVIKLDEIPLTVNSKVDKKALPKVDMDKLLTEYVAPNTETEKIIVKTFEKAFNQEKISLYDDFIRLGGDSIIAMKIVSDLSEQDIDIDARTIFKNRTPYNIAQIIDGNEKEYGFELAKKGSENKNMFLLPPNSGLSFIFSTLIKNIDFDGNIYIIDDYRYELTIKEIERINGTEIALEKYYEAIKDIFQDGDIIAGYSHGCIFASLLCERLEKSKYVDKCVLIDGSLKFSEKSDYNETKINQLKEDAEELLKDAEEYKNDDELKNKLIAVTISNSEFNFKKPKIKSHVIYLSTTNKCKKELKEISSNYEYHNIDTTHGDIIGKDLHKINKYLK